MSGQDSSSRFYADLKAFSDFEEMTDLDKYSPLPDDWTFLVSDVVDSTSAIADGRYKAVNMVGAATITAVLNVSQGLQLPFAFGGDGGLIAVPPELRDAATRELARLKNASSRLFGLDLRAAAIPVADLRAAGAETQVRKYALSKGNDLAMFAGAGPRMADRWLKEDIAGGRYAVQTGDNELPNLEGLSCRWEPLKSRNGTMLTIIAQPVEKDAGRDLYELTRAIRRILDSPISDHAPVHGSTMKLRFPPSGLALEIAAGAKKSPLIRRTIRTCFLTLVHYACERFGLKLGGYDRETYRQEVETNTDFRKYDGSLRMVLDITAAQATDIQAILERMHQTGKLVYGTWRADAALMTCLLFSLSDSQHMHFIDGADGGYAMAALDLKRRLAGDGAG
ncbi:DUF3095 domain-containing protein [uncultured Roseibium sp.]|uniref:DUF3095 domain-containing protein n=1 Tax=uncultured Roseibium sp. TaxID=1936171 RepID=UPI00321663D9